MDGGGGKLSGTGYEAACDRSAEKRHLCSTVDLSWCGTVKAVGDWRLARAALNCHEGTLSAEIVAVLFLGISLACLV